MYIIAAVPSLHVSLLPGLLLAFSRAAARFTVAMDWLLATAARKSQLTSSPATALARFTASA
jgi:hypothetical protein